MKKVELKLNLVVYDSLNDLSDLAKAVMETAIDARENAYAPYSKFKVGAALLLENGQIVTGNNQENAAYPSGMCAERVAVWKAASDFPKETIKMLAITAKSASRRLEEPVAPCGACRQTLSEYELNQKSPVTVYFMGEKGKIIKMNSLLDLLPVAFDKSFL